MSKTIFDNMSGQILYTVHGIMPIDIDNYVDGEYNDKEYYVDVTTKTVINKPTQPSVNYTWNNDSKSWILDNTVASISVRNQRNLLLSAIDCVNPIWYTSLSTDQQQELVAYRLALLAVPQQTDFPVSIEWPTKPSWL